MALPPACVVCGQRSRELELILEPGKIMRCLGCSLVSMVEHDGLNFVSCRYDRDYYSRDDAGGVVGYPDYFGSERSDRRQIADVFAGAICGIAPGLESFLEIGCGGGYLVDALSRRGVRAVGVDISEFAITEARRCGAGVFVCGEVDDPEVRRRGPYDVVALMDVVEHLRDPVACLAATTPLVREGGRILLLTPRYGGRLRYAQAESYIHFNSDHIYYFTADTLYRMLVKAVGDRLVEITDVLTAVRRAGVQLPDVFRVKYSTDRDSILAVVSC